MPVRRPTSLFSTLRRKVLEESLPFIYISALPSCTRETAFNAACSSSFSSMISILERSIPSPLAMSLILFSSPTRMGSAMSLLCASATASSTGSSAAAATASFFLEHLPTCARMSSNVSLILPFPPTAYFYFIFFECRIPAFLSCFSHTQLPTGQLPTLLLIRAVTGCRPKAGSFRIHTLYFAEKMQSPVVSAIPH